MSAKQADTLTEIDYMEIPVVGFVGANPRVVQFPCKVAPVAKELKKFIVSGDSLECPANPQMSVYDGDRIILRDIHHISDISPHKVYVVLVTATGELLAKKIVLKDNFVLLRSVNPKYTDVVYDKKLIQIIGEVVEICRNYQP